MKLEGKKVLVVGAGKSGIAASELLLDKKIETVLYDGNKDLDVEKLYEKAPKLKGMPVLLGELTDEQLRAFDVAVLSPGVPTDLPVVERMRAQNVCIWGEIELAYSFAKGRLIAITGTNGKTTTTALTGEIMKNYFKDMRVVGNIGIPYTSEAATMTDETVTVAEISSFQLETIHEFHPQISAILNITPDHLNRHHTMECYIRTKEAITTNQTNDEVCVLNYEDEVLRAFGESAPVHVAKAGDGSMRDALSLLDQCIAFHLGEKLTYENVLEVLGAVDTEVFSALLRQVLAKDVTGAILTVDQLVDQGRELGQMVNDFTWYMRNLLLIQSADDMEDVLDMSAEHLAALKEEAQMVEPETLIRYIRIFSELSSQIRYAAQKRILLEIAIIKLCRPQMEKDLSALNERMDDIEQKLESGAFVSAAPQSTVSPVSSGADGAGTGTPEKPELPKAIPEDIKQVMQNWRSVISEMGGITRQYLNQAVPTLGPAGELLLMFDDANAFAYLNDNKAGCIDHLKEMITQRCAKQVEVQLRLNEGGRSAANTVPDLRQLINFDIEEENF